MSFLSWLSSEAVAVQGVVQTSLTLFVAFGLHLSVAQVGAILGVSAAVLTIITRQVVVANVAAATTTAAQAANNFCQLSLAVSGSVKRAVVSEPPVSLCQAGRSSL